MTLTLDALWLVAAGLFATASLPFSESSHRAAPAELVADVAPDSSDEAAYWVRHVGDRRLLMQGDLGARIALDSLRRYRHLYALGPVEGLRGEITVFDGVSSVAVVEDGRPLADTTTDVRASFLAYAHVPAWEAQPVEIALGDQDSVAALVERAAREAGLDLDEPFPFRIEGPADEVVYHIIFKTDDAPHDHAAHQRAKRMFTLEREPVEVLGFYRHAGGGPYHHPGKRVHLHVRSGDGRTSGHVDGLRLPPGTTLYLPRLP